jgi:hypothetical protein
MYTVGRSTSPAATPGVRCSATDERSMRTSPTSVSSEYVRKPPKMPNMTTLATA